MRVLQNTLVLSLALFSAACQAQPPLAPEDLEWRGRFDTVTLTWSASASADDYAVFRKTDTEVVFTEVGTTVYETLTDEMPGPAAYADYYVTARNVSGSSPPSETVRATCTPRRGSPPC